jgi:hypothetical protein
MKITYSPKQFYGKSWQRIQKADQILTEYAKQGLILTLRQLYYQFVARGWIENSLRSYKQLQQLVNDARLAGHLDWDALEDRTRNLQSPPWWSSPKDILTSCARSYKEDLWANQPYRVEVWVEKDALVSVIERACQARRVPFFSCRGYASQSEVWSASERFKECGKPVRIIHLGDHDPSGCDMTRDIEARLVNVFGCPSLEVDRIALNMDQIRKYNPPPNPAKLTDSRCEGYMATHGDSSWELDALEPRVLHTLITDAIERSVDSEVWDHDAELEAGHRTELTRFRDEYDTANQLLDAAANGDNLVDMKADLYGAREELGQKAKVVLDMQKEQKRMHDQLDRYADEKTALEERLKSLREALDRACI